MEEVTTVGPSMPNGRAAEAVAVAESDAGENDTPPVAVVTCQSPSQTNPARTGAASSSIRKVAKSFARPFISALPWAGPPARDGPL